MVEFKYNISADDVSAYSKKHDISKTYALRKLKIEQIRDYLQKPEPHMPSVTLAIFEMMLERT